MNTIRIANINDTYNTRYVVENHYTGEVFRNLDRFDVEELLVEWLAEDGYEWEDGEIWQSYRWADYSPGYIVRRQD